MSNHKHDNQALRRELAQEIRDVRKYRKFDLYQEAGGQEIWDGHIEAAQDIKLLTTLFSQRNLKEGNFFGTFKVIFGDSDRYSEKFREGYNSVMDHFEKRVRGDL